MGWRRGGRRISVMLVICAVAALAAVPAGSSTRRAVPAKTWANNLCASIGSWAAGIQLRTATYNNVLEDWKAHGKNNVRKIRGIVVVYVTDVTASTDAMVRKVKKGGAPAVPKGATTQRGVTAALDQVDAVFHKALVSARALPSSNAILFIRKANALARQISSGLAGIGAAFTAVGSTAAPQLEAAAKAAPACKKLG